MEETASVWYILTGDRIRLDGKEVEVLDKNLVPPGQRGRVLSPHQGGEPERAFLANLPLVRRSNSHLLLSGADMIYTVKPIAAGLLKSGDTFRDGGCTHRVIGVDHNEITYSTEPSKPVYSFYVQPDDVVDLIIDRQRND